MNKKNMPAHLRIKHLLSELCGLQISGWHVPAAQKIIDRLAVIADELRQAEKAELSTEDPILSPEHQTQQALMRAASVKDGREAATWAIAAAVFSLRDTMAEAMNAKAAAPAVAEPDRSQLTPEEVAEIRRANQDFMIRHAVMYPDKWTANVKDMRKMWTVALDRNMKGKLP